MRSAIAFLVLFAGASPTMSQTSTPTALDATAAQGPQERPRARDAGVVVGIMQPGAKNAITDVAGVRVGHTTIARDSIHTGVTAILPHAGNVFRERVPAAIVVGNGFGKLIGVSQVGELGEIETPILLTCTLCVWRAADAMVDWLLRQPGMDDVRSINPVVGETNDGGLNDIRARPITPEDVVQALEGAGEGPVAEGAVGAGAGTIAFGWKGGIGTSSRVLPTSLGGYAIGVLVQSNYGGVLTINGAPVGRELGRYAFQRDVEGQRGDRDDDAGDSGVSSARKRPEPLPQPELETRNPKPETRARGASADGSIMIVVATDAPLDARNLERLATRALTGLARTGASMTNGSGDYVIAFSTAPSVRRIAGAGDAATRSAAELANDAMSPLFQAVAEATEEAIYNSLFRAHTVRSGGRTVEALPLDRTLEILEKYGALHGSLRPHGG
ncbi:MAG: P1 family peptidase [Longimicrobiales bacterium]